MTKRCGKLYDGDKRCGWFAGHDGPCGPWQAEPRMPFGQHKGLQIRSLPDSYLDWIVTTNFIEAPRHRMLRSQLWDEYFSRHPDAERRPDC